MENRGAKPKKKKEIQSTLFGMEKQMVMKRQSGNTTKLIDNAIQILFSGKICLVQDHWQYGFHREANINLYNRIMDRLVREHSNLKDKIKVDKEKFTIEITE